MTRGPIAGVGVTCQLREETRLIWELGHCLGPVTSCPVCPGTTRPVSASEPRGQCGPRAWGRDGEASGSGPWANAPPDPGGEPSEMVVSWGGPQWPLAGQPGQGLLPEPGGPRRHSHRCPLGRREPLKGRAGGPSGRQHPHHLQVFHVAYVLIKFANAPRPDLWVLERSMDFGHTYQPWQFFACESPRARGWRGRRVSPEVGCHYCAPSCLASAWVRTGCASPKAGGGAVPVPDTEPTVPMQSLGSLWTGFLLWQLVSDKGGPLSCPTARARSATPMLPDWPCHVPPGPVMCVG